MTARKRAEQPEPHEAVEGVEVVRPTDEPTGRELDGPADEPTDDVAPIVEGSPVSSAARHNARYGDLDGGDDPADADAT